MKTYRKQSGPFTERPFYELHDIENICSEELKSAGLHPSEPSPIRVERFIEKRFKVNPVYEDLPDGILGYSRFGKAGLEGIVISRALAEDQSRSTERRVTTTLAHEAGHALLHAHLFALGMPQPGLFGSEITTPKILCRNESMPAMNSGKKYDGRWWEFQANQAIGALLLPRALTVKALEPLLDASGILGASQELPAGRREEAVILLSKVFDVNPIVARIRLEELYPSGGEQLTL